MDSSSIPAPEILLQHGRALRRLGRELLRDAHLAEDLAQDTLVRWFERSPGPLRKEGNWLRVVLRNLGLKAVRRRTRAVERERRAARAEALPSAADEAAHAELLRRVVDAVLALEEPYRATVLARYLRGLEAREIAETSGVPLSTVRSREQRALEKLRVKLDRAYGDRGAWGTALGTLVELEGAKGATSVLATSAATKTFAAALILLSGAFLGWRLTRPSPSHPSPGEPAPTVASAPEDPSESRAQDTPGSSGDRVPLEGASGKTLRISGHLIDLPYPELSLPERPGAGIEVAVSVEKSSGSGGGWWARNALATSATTDEAGRFAVDVPDPGQRPLGILFTVQEDATYRALWNERSIPYGANALEGLELQRVAHGVLHGETVDPRGRPLADVRVRFLGSGGRVVAEVSSDEIWGVPGREPRESPARGGRFPGPLAARLHRARPVRGRRLGPDAHHARPGCDAAPAGPRFRRRAPHRNLRLCLGRGSGITRETWD